MAYVNADWIAGTLNGIVEGLLGSAVDGAQPLMEVRFTRLDLQQTLTGAKP